jgi:hypothetical protein
MRSIESFYGRISRIDRDGQAVRRESGIIHPERSSTRYSFRVKIVILKYS